MRKSSRESWTPGIEKFVSVSPRRRDIGGARAFGVKPAALLLAMGMVLPAAAATAPGDSAARMPAERNYSYSYDLIDHSLIRPATRALDAARLVRRIGAHPREAANVDENDQVRLPSTWWQPRVGFRTVTPEQILAGPGSGTGPARGRWTVSHGKDQGVTPGFQIKDATGDKFLIKFDPPGLPNLSTSAGAIGSRLLWAAGYNVSDDAVSHFRFEDLAIAKDATYLDARGRKRPMTRAYLQTVLAKVDQNADSSYSCLASRYLEGRPLGPFEFHGRRKDDPEDLIPHELRRELRGLWTVCAWLNHADSRGPNSLDMWVTEDGRSFVRHYLMDYNAILGAGPRGARAYPTGTEYYVDFGVMSRHLVTLGLVPFDWEASVDPHLPSVGFVESKTFDPAGWRPDYPNPAFDERTARDIRWGARIVAGFTDAQIRAAVTAAHYTDPRAAGYITRVLIERRDRLADRWLGRQPSPAISAR